MSTSTATRFCTQCGRAATDDLRFCTGCGVQFDLGGFASMSHKTVRTPRLKSTKQSVGSSPRAVKSRTQQETVPKLTKWIIAILVLGVVGTASAFVSRLSVDEGRIRSQGYEVGYNEGVTEGLAKGRSEGFTKGRSEGYEAGKTAVAQICADIGEAVPVGIDDPNGIDMDGDGWGCEEYSTRRQSTSQDSSANGEPAPGFPPLEDFSPGGSLFPDDPFGDPFFPGDPFGDPYFGDPYFD